MSVMNDMLESEFQLKQEIESLRQQLAALQDDLEVAKNVANGNVEAKFDAWRQLGAYDKQLTNSQKQVKMLRDALMFCQSKIAYMLRNGEWYNPELALDTAREALAATEPKEQWK